MTLDDELLTLCAETIDAQHKAIDLLLAKLAASDPTFRPSQSGAWPAVIKGHAVLVRLRRRAAGLEFTL